MANQKTERTPKKKTRPSPGRTNPDAAGIDLGATIHYVAVPADRDEKPVRHFGTLTEDLTELADWLKQCGITTVAMEATGVYWIPLFQILEDCGFEVCLVNARHVKNVPGRKSDVQDCQWLQYLHSVGLLNASFRPPAEICAVRSLMRHRESMMRTSCQHLLRVQKSLDQMNVQLHHAVTDITGYTGLAILDAIVAGERDPEALARLRDRRCKKSEAEIARALKGDWREEHLFTLCQSLEAWRFHQALMTACDERIASRMEALEDRGTGPTPMPGKKSSKPQEEPMREQLYEKFGVELTAVKGVSIQTCLAFLSEVGADVDRFATAEHFAILDGIVPRQPDHRRADTRRPHPQSPKPLGQRTSHGGAIAASIKGGAGRLVSQTEIQAWHEGGGDRRRPQPSGARQPNGGAFARRAAQGGGNLARILWSMVKHRRPYDPQRLGNPELARARKESYLRRQAEQLGFALTPVGGEVS